MNTLISPLQRLAIAEGRKHHYRFTAVTEDNYKVGWVYERIAKAPVIASGRIKTLEAAGIRVKEILIAHEAPKLLGAPKTEPKPKQDFKITDSASIPNAFPLAEILVSTLMVVVPMFIELFFRIILLDPAIVVVLEDGTWLEVCNYYD